MLDARPARAEDTEVLLERIEQLELRIRDLEANRAVPGAGDTGRSGQWDWTRYLRIGGSANAGYFGGGGDSLQDPDGFGVSDARLFVDANLGQDVRVGESVVLRDVGLSLEWDLVRLGTLSNQVGELYVDFQGILGRDWLNLQVGRFQIPVGEAYQRYSHGYASKPFISNPVGAPWWWDEGVRGYGTTADGKLGFVWSVTDGDTPFNAAAGGGSQTTLRLFANPFEWLHLSVSGLRNGETGSSGTPASTALWLGESWGRAFGSGTGVPSYQDGAIVPDGPNELDQTWFIGSDAILDFEDRARLWLAYGRYDIDSSGPSLYDRVLHYWIAELLLRGAWLDEALRPLWLGFRASGLGTWDPDAGYLLDVRRGSTLGYNTESITAWSAVVGWELTRNLRLRAEYTHQDIALVHGVSDAIRSAARDADYFALEVGAGF